jgi:hypothetical protein
MTGAKRSVTLATTVRIYEVTGTTTPGLMVMEQNNLDQPAGTHETEASLPGAGNGPSCTADDSGGITTTNGGQVEDLLRVSRLQNRLTGNRQQPGCDNHNARCRHYRLKPAHQHLLVARERDRTYR